MCVNLYELLIIKLTSVSIGITNTLFYVSLGNYVPENIKKMVFLLDIKVVLSIGNLFIKENL